MADRAVKLPGSNRSLTCVVCDGRLIAIEPLYGEFFPRRTCKGKYSFVCGLLEAPSCIMCYILSNTEIAGVHTSPRGTELEWQTLTTRCSPSLAFLSCSEYVKRDEPEFSVASAQKIAVCGRHRRQCRRSSWIVEGNRHIVGTSFKSRTPQRFKTPDLPDQALIAANGAANNFSSNYNMAETAAVDTLYIAASTNRHAHAADVQDSLIAFGSSSLVGLWDAAVRARHLPVLSYKPRFGSFVGWY